MINIIKSTPPPQCLEKEKNKVNGDYKCCEVLERTQTDFKNKCYLCELKEPTSINVEHFIPHRGDKNLKFDWYNLFWSCPHCNNTKLDKIKYENILNCTNPDHDVENWLKYEMKPLTGEMVKIIPIKEDEIVDNTSTLLLAIYNGATRLKKIESANLRKALLKEINDFQEQLLGYKNMNENGGEKEFYLEKIKEHLRKSSAFTAFKRWIIKEDSFLRENLEQYFD
ncbi:MAG: HNH endonuclease [Acidobacteria bacterium]|jgi:hypothetical protein|nr:HNH endonuclease [Acidobacteriota bacterium]